MDPIRLTVTAKELIALDSMLDRAIEAGGAPGPIYKFAAKVKDRMHELESVLDEIGGPSAG